MLSKYGAADYVFQFITVTAGVLIALMIDGLVDWKNNRDLVVEARATIQREIADNKKELEGTISNFPRDLAEMASAIQFADDMLGKGKTDIRSINLHYNLADLSSAGWHTAERTGALSHMDYGEVQRYSKLYDLQDLFVEQQRAILNQLTAASSLLAGNFNPDKPDKNDLVIFRERVMQLRGALDIQKDFAARLAERYSDPSK